MGEDIEADWTDTMERLSVKFGQEIDMEGILFLIGIQELGKGPGKFEKQQKLELLHIATCALLEPFGYYKYSHRDEDGWPHWTVIAELPFMKPGEQKLLMKKAVIRYFKEKEPI